MPWNGKLLRETETKRTLIACETLTSLSVPYSFRNKVILQFTFNYIDVLSLQTMRGIQR